MSELKRGWLFCVAAYAMWGLFPLYWKLLRPTGAVEILAHRFLWSFVLVAVVLLALRRFGTVKAVFRRRRTLAAVTVAGVFISANWGTYIYGVNTDRVVETSLGYFLNPLVTVLMGVIVLRERLRAAQWAAVAIGFIALGVLTVDYGHLPWIALVLGFSFATYGLVKKQVKLPAAEGLFTETSVLMVPVLGFLGWLTVTGDSSFTSVSAGHSLLLVGAGVVTAIPLLFFAGAANRLPMTALGMGQYIAPTIQFLIGIVVYHEAMSPARWVGFGLVWLALVVFTGDAVRHARARSRRPEPATATAVA